MTTDTTPGHAVYGTTPRTYIPASVAGAGFYDLCPASLRPDGSRPRHLFDVTTEEGRAARDAFHADRAAWEALKDEAYARHEAKATGKVENGGVHSANRTYDLTTQEGRAALRAYLDEVDAHYAEANASPSDGI